MLENKFFIAGSDYFSIDKRGAAIVQTFSNREVEIIDSNAIKIAEALQELQQVLESLRTISMFSSQKFVWYKNVTFLSDAAVMKSEDVTAWIQKIQQILLEAPEVGFLLTTTTIDKRQKIIKWFLENCRSEIFEEQKKITPNALNFLLQCTGNDLMTLDGELDKLLLYVDKSNEITIQDVDAIVVDLHRSDFFETVDLFFEANIEQFSRGIRRYFLYQEEGRPLLAALQNRTRLIVQLCYFYETDGLSRVSKSALEQLKVKYESLCHGNLGSIFVQNPWYLGKLLEIAKKYSLGDWMKFHTLLLSAVVELAENYDRQQTIFEKLYFHLKSFPNSPKMEKNLEANA
jgi:DNA polymerase-3 subunit delta